MTPRAGFSITEAIIKAYGAFAAILGMIALARDRAWA
jgi:hypothetical protein